MISDPQVQLVLTKLAKLNADESFWCVPQETAAFLYQTVLDRNAQCVCEVGTSIGYSSLYFADALRQTGGVLHTVESHKERFEMGEQHFEEAGVTDIVTHHKGHAPEIFEENICGQPIDIAFFDGIKKESHRHIDAVRPYMAPGGLMIVDNTQSHREAVQPLFDYLAAEQLDFEESDLGDGLVLIQS